MKVAVCTPHHANVHAKFTASLFNMMEETRGNRITFNGSATTPDVRLFMNSASALPAQRNMLAHNALEWGANYLLWLDSDHIFPVDTLTRLLSLNLPVVGANYPRRTYPTFPTALSLSGEHVWTTQELAESGTVEQIASLGLGVCLMDMTVLDRLYQHALSQGRDTFWPLFAYEIVPGNLLGVGEDTYFFNGLKEAGIGVYVDHALSWQVGHIFEVVLSNADALDQKESYLRSRGLPPA
ncbi:MAG: hypothetical protein M3Q08_07220 [Pseudomonadota bacterium]|nr:hypothetical protein [Pseudomonadota bacterium]